MQDTAGEAGTHSYGLLHMAEQKQDDQHEHTFSNYVRIRDVVQKTCQRRWTIGKSGERGSGISVLPARHDDDDVKLNIDLKNLQNSKSSLCCERYETINHVISQCKENKRRDTNEWGRWSIGNCARSLILTILPNGTCTNQNLSWRISSSSSCHTASTDLPDSLSPPVSIVHRRTLSATTTPSQSRPGSMAMKEYSAFPKAPALLEPHHQIV